MTIYIPHFKSLVLKQILLVKENKANYTSLVIEVIVIFFTRGLGWLIGGGTVGGWLPAPRREPALGAPWERGPVH